MITLHGVGWLGEDKIFWQSITGQVRFEQSGLWETRRAY